MENKKSVKKNYIYNLTYQMLTLLTPLLVMPYIARILGEYEIGKYSFSSSILTYFTLFAAFGFTIYAQRIIAEHQGDITAQSRAFWEIIIARLISVILAIGIYFALIVFGAYDDKYVKILIILSIDILAIAFDITFIFQGNEQFDKIVLINIIVKIVSVASVFVFIKGEEDLLKYVLIHSASVIGGNLLLWIFLPKMLVRVELKTLKPLKHIKPTFILFLPTIANSIYTSLDKTLIGIITKNDSENGNYEYAEKIVKMSLTVISALGVVMFPRNSKDFADGNIENVKINARKAVGFVWLLAVPMVLGIIAVADNFCPWYFGEGFKKVPILMKILSPIILIIGLSNVFGVQILVPGKRDKRLTVALLGGAIVNFTLNCFFIRFWQSEGAAIATVVAETVVTVLMLYFARDFIGIKQVLISSVKYVIAGAVMAVPCFILGSVLEPSIINTLIIVASGIFTYGIMLIVLREYFTIGILNKILSIINRKK